MTRPGALPGTLPGVDQPRTLRVTLDFEQGSDPPRGRLLATDTTQSFTGWLGLAIALERALAPLLIQIPRAGVSPGSLRALTAQRLADERKKEETIGGRAAFPIACISPTVRP